VILQRIQGRYVLFGVFRLWKIQMLSLPVRSTRLLLNMNLSFSWFVYFADLVERGTVGYLTYAIRCILSNSESISRRTFTALSFWSVLLCRIELIFFVFYVSILPRDVMLARYMQGWF